jgi:hypothetical protein
MTAAMAANPGDQSAPAYLRMKQSGQWNLSDPQSPTWEYLNSLANPPIPPEVQQQNDTFRSLGLPVQTPNTVDVRNDPGALVQALHASGVGAGVGQNRDAYERELRTALSGLPEQFVNPFTSTAGQNIQHYWDSLPDDSMTIGNVLHDVGSGVLEFGQELTPLVLAALATYGGVAGLGGLAGGAEAAGAASAGGTAAGSTGGSALGSGLTPGAAGVTGITPGVASTSIGGGALGSGIGAGAGGASGLAAAGATGLGALAANSLAGETLAPVIGGASGTLSAGAAPIGAASGGGTAAGGVASAGGSALSRILGGTGTTADYLSLLGTAGAVGLGVAGANSQQNALEGLAREYMAMGAPYRQRLSDLYADPSAYLTSPEVTVPVQQGTDALARALSIHGNPVGSGTALHELQNYASNQLYGRLGQERDRLAGFGGLTSYNAAAPGAATAGINAGRGLYDALGYGLQQITRQPSGLERLLSGGLV